MSLGTIPKKGIAEIRTCRKCSKDMEEMGILHINENLGSASAQTQILIDYIESKGFKMNDECTLDHRYAKWDQIFDAHEIDIVIIGNYPNNAEDLARRVIQRNPLIDILLYGYDNARISAPTKYSKYGAIQVHYDSQYAKSAISMIRAHRHKWNDMVFLRGLVISQIVDIESHINNALLAYFCMESSRSEYFKDMILDNPAYSLEGKKQVLRKIVRDLHKPAWSGMDKKIENLQKNRNKLAHCEVDPDDPNRITSMNKEYHYDRSNMRNIIKEARLVREKLSHITEILKNDGTCSRPPNI